jgi:hypothetical protein
MGFWVWWEGEEGDWLGAGFPPVERASLARPW